jgi:hypothetical protein
MLRGVPMRDLHSNVAAAASMVMSIPLLQALTFYPYHRTRRQKLTQQRGTPAALLTHPGWPPPALVIALQHLQGLWRYLVVIIKQALEVCLAALPPGHEQHLRVGSQVQKQRCRQSVAASSITSKAAAKLCFGCSKQPATPVHQDPP